MCCRGKLRGKTAYVYLVLQCAPLTLVSRVSRGAETTHRLNEKRLKRSPCRSPVRRYVFGFSLISNSALPASAREPGASGTSTAHDRLSDPDPRTWAYTRAHFWRTTESGDPNRLALRRRLLAAGGRRWHLEEGVDDAQAEVAAAREDVGLYGRAEGDSLLHAPDQSRLRLGYVPCRRPRRALAPRAGGTA